MNAIERMKEGLIIWYPFRMDARILYIGESSDAVAGGLKARGLHTDVFAMEHLPNAGAYDHVICISAIERAKDPHMVLEKLLDLTKPEGSILLGMNNRFGIRYFSGDRDPYTGASFTGIENYYHPEFFNRKEPCGRMYARNEIDRMLEESGWSKRQFYSVLPGLDHPLHLFAEGTVPNEDLANRVLPLYSYPQSVFLEEERLYQHLIENDMFHPMANAYLVEATREGTLSDVRLVTASMERDEANAMLTVVYGEERVEKAAVYPEGSGRLGEIKKNCGALRERGIATVDFEVENNRGIMPFIKGKAGQKHLLELLRSDKEVFLAAMDHFMELVQKSSDIIRVDDELGPIAENAYMDMVPLNTFLIDDEFVFFDQEFVLHEYPLNVVLARVLFTFYAYHDELNEIINSDELFARYGLLEKRDTWKEMELSFLLELWQTDELEAHRTRYRRNTSVTLRNRHRMSYSSDEYRRIFMHPFEGAEDKKLILFGSGKYAESFLDLYQPVFDIEAIVDNNTDRHGQEMRGIKIASPGILKSFTGETHKLIVCVKDCFPVFEQLNEMGVDFYSLYDGQTIYPRVLRGTAEKAGEEKPYKVGYISGVFDLFHKGHLNLLRRAKARCEYLIVGVVSDEGVRMFKHVEPFIPFEERLEMVASCRFVDEAVKIPLYHRGVRDAYHLYHFDCQFCGSDYLKDPVFMADRLWLEEQGSEMEILPYTESTSSTKIKRLIEDKLL